MCRILVSAAFKDVDETKPPVFILSGFHCRLNDKEPDQSAGKQIAGPHYDFSCRIFTSSNTEALKNII